MLVYHNEKIEVYPNLFIGSDNDVKNWTHSIIHAARDPWFKDFPKEHLWHENQCELYLNLVDARNIEYIPIPLIEKSLDFIDKKIKENKVLVHCNCGLSRGPSIGYLYLLKYTNIFEILTMEESIQKYTELYPWWSPGPGMALFCIMYYRKLKGVL